MTCSMLLGSYRVAHFVPYVNRATRAAMELVKKKDTAPSATALLLCPCVEPCIKNSTDKPGSRVVVRTREVHADGLQNGLEPRVQPGTSSEAANQEAGLWKQASACLKGIVDKVVDLPSLSLRPPSAVHGLRRRWQQWKAQRSRPPPHCIQEHYVSKPLNASMMLEHTPPGSADHYGFQHLDRGPSSNQT